MPFRNTSLRLALLLILAAAAALPGCDLFEEDDDEAPLEAAGVYVGNGGNFGDQNGFVTVYDPETEQAANPSYLDAGAFLNSLTLTTGGQLYALLNTGFSSGRISRYDVVADAQVAQSDSLGAVRYLALASPEKAYATTLGGAVVALDPSTLETLSDPIEVGASAQGVAVAAGKAFVAVYGSGTPRTSGAGTTLAVIDTATDALTGTVELGCDGPYQVFVDEEEEIAVVCTGSTTSDENYVPVSMTDGAVVFVDPETEAVTARVPLDAQLGSANFTQVAHYAAGAEAIHAISSASGTVYRFDTDANALSDSLAVPAAAGLVGLTSVAYDAAAGRLYLGRFPVGEDGQSPSYTAAGSVVILDEDGTAAGRFQAGPSIAHIAIRR